MTITAVRCCLSPDDRHAAYCITTRQQHTPGLFGPGTFGTWSDQRVLQEMHRQADTCVAVMAMPEDVRHRVGPKGAASPAQAAVLNAVIVRHLEREAVARGLIVKK